MGWWHLVTYGLENRLKKKQLFVVYSTLALCCCSSYAALLRIKIRSSKYLCVLDGCSGHVADCRKQRHEPVNTVSTKRERPRAHNSCLGPIYKALRPRRIILQDVRPSSLMYGGSLRLVYIILCSSHVSLSKFPPG